MWREYTYKLLIATQGIRSNFLRKSKISNKQIWLLQCPYFMSPSQLSLRTFCCFLIILFHCRAWSLLLHRECFSCPRRFESVCGSWLLWIRNEGTGGFHAPLLRLFSLLEEKRNTANICLHQEGRPTKFHWILSNFKNCVKICTFTDAFNYDQYSLWLVAMKGFACSILMMPDSKPIIMLAYPKAECFLVFVFFHMAWSLYQYSDRCHDNIIIVLFRDKKKILHELGSQLRYKDYIIFIFVFWIFYIYYEETLNNTVHKSCTFLDPLLLTVVLFADRQGCRTSTFILSSCLFFQ